MRISDWSSDVCSSDLLPPPNVVLHTRSAMMTMLAVANSDLLTILPAQWLHLPPASPNIVVFPFRERLHAAPICMVHRADLPLTPLARSEERRVGKECVSTCRSRWSPYHSKKKAQHIVKVANTVESNTQTENNIKTTKV